MVTRKPLPGQSSPPPVAPTSIPIPPAFDANGRATTKAAGLEARLSAVQPAPPRYIPEEEREPSDDDDEWNDSEPEWDADSVGDEQDAHQNTSWTPAPLPPANHQQTSTEPLDKNYPVLPPHAAPPPIPMANHASSPTLHPTNTGQSQASAVTASSVYSQTSTSPQSNNPFLRPQNTGEALFGPESSAIHQPTPPNFDQSNRSKGPSNGDLLSLDIPTSDLGHLTLNEHNEPPRSPPPPGRQAPLIPFEREESRDSLPEVVLQQTYSPPTSLPPQPPNAHFGQEYSSAPKPTSPIPFTSRCQSGATPPPKPPRPSIEPPQSPFARPQSGAGTPTSARQRQRKEHYQIKHVRWYDTSCRRTRVSPILTQNLNGPCPLLALVNALVLSTPIDVNTGLVETLRIREQVSLGLLLDAVFDELVSRGQENAEDPLPDVGELYAFLLTLHTGMNVNPKFVIDPNNATPSDSQPGTFEQTKEMRLYSTFGVPLVHGWIPTAESHAHAAFERTAKTYEDAQNVLFHVEELEHKIGNEGLTEPEQDLFEDLMTIKEFLGLWPTQLTDHGLEVISRSIAPGNFAILFRNDHFSTVFKEPRSSQLLTLVTDAGYSTHDEIVWESLVDINGMHSEYFSGDFRAVSHSQQSQPSQSNSISPGPRNSSLNQQNVRSMLDVDVDQGWTTVTSRRDRGKQPSDQETGILHNRNASSSSGFAAPTTGPPPPPLTTHGSHEQEDADLALALQLQEEEEERVRQANVQRQREDHLSQQFLERSGSAPNAPPRRPSPGSTNRPSIPPRRNQSNAEEAPPPTYEQAAQSRPFVPGSDHPASPLAPLSPTNGRGGSYMGANNRRTSAYAANSSAYSGVYGPGVGRRSQSTALVDRIPSGSGLNRRSSNLGPGGQDDREKCVVM